MEFPLQSNKPHVVCLPFPTQGHINPMFKLAILLHHKGFHITFVNTEYNHNRLLRSWGLAALDSAPDFRFETIPDGLSSMDADTTQDIPSLFMSTQENCLPSFRQLLAKLNNSFLTEGIPKVTCIISDAIMTFSVTAAGEISVPVVCFRTTNACSFLCNKHVPLLIQKRLLPLRDSNCLTNGYLDTPIDCIPALKNIRIREFPTFVRTTDINNPMLNFVMGETERASKASAIIFNTFDELEADALAALKPLCPPVYAIGSVHLYVNQLPQNSLRHRGSSLWKEESQCLSWLDSQKPNSVVYVNFGSITVLTQHQLTEFACGLANSGKNFIWVIRPDPTSPTLPSNFIAETKDRGFITEWCPQEQVLNHPCIAAFLTHCGWNSMIESISSGVPMICWPVFADQQINCRFACLEWGVGVEISGGDHVRREEVERVVREMVGGVEGEGMREKAAEWRRKAEEAVGVGGSAWLSLDKLVKEVLLAKVDVI